MNAIPMGYEEVESSGIPAGYREVSSDIPTGYEEVPSQPLSIELGTGGVEEALAEPSEIPGAVRELGGVVKSGLSGGARAASELALFPVRAVGELAAASAGRTGAFEGYPGAEGGGKTDVAAQKWFSDAFQGGLEKGKSLLFGDTEQAKMVEEGVSLPFEPITKVAQQANRLAEKATGDPLVGKLAEYGTLLGVFRAIHAGSESFRARGRVPENIASRLETLKEEIGSENIPAGSEDILGKPTPEDLKMMEEVKRETSPVNELRESFREFGKYAEDQVGRRSVGQDDIKRQIVDVTDAMVYWEEPGKGITDPYTGEFKGRTKSTYPPWFKMEFPRDTLSDVIKASSKWLKGGEEALGKKESRIVSTLKRVAEDAEADGVNLAEEGWRSLFRSEVGAVNTKVITDFKEFWQPFSTVPEGKQYLALRYKGLYGGLARVDRVIKRVSDRYQSMPDQAKKDVFNAIRGELPMDSLPADLQRIARQTIGDTNRVGKMLVKRGMLSEETFLANKDQYIHYMYLRHILPDGSPISAGRGGRLDLSYLKARKDLTELQRKELGLIEDVSVAAPVGVGKALGDMVKEDFYREISSNPEWVWQPSLELAKLTKEHKAYQQIMERAENVTPEVAARFQQLDTKLKELSAASGKAPEDFVQIPESRAFGSLSGAFVRREIANDIMPIITASADSGRLVNLVRKTAGGGMTMFKVGKVALNPPTMVRNMFSNLIQMNMSGIPFYRIPSVIVDGLRSMKAKDANYRKLQRLGGFQTNFSVAEIGEVLRIFEEAKGGSFSGFFGAVNKVAKFYGKIDDVAKMSLYKDSVNRLGMDPVDAAAHAQKWGMDYSLASRSVKYARRYALPFVSYQYKIAPLIVETLSKRPWVIAKYAAIPYILSLWASKEFDWTEKDLDKAQKMMAARTKGEGAYVLLPVKDNKGNVEIVNLEYFLPWGNWMEVARSAKGGSVTDALKQFGFGGPFGNIISMLNNKRVGEPPKDPFTGRPVYSPLDPPETQYIKMAEWWWQNFGPSSLSSSGALGYTVDAIQGEKNRWGTEATPLKAAGRWLGVNVGSLNPRQVTAQKKARIGALEKEARRIMRDPAYSKEQRKEAVKRLREERIKIIKGE